MSHVEVVVNPAAAHLMAEGYARSTFYRKGPQVVERAQFYAPVRTGELRDSISYQVDMSGDMPRLIVFAAAPYAGYVEAGTSRMAAQPFLAPAASDVL